MTWTEVPALRPRQFTGITKKSVSSDPDETGRPWSSVTSRMAFPENLDEAVRNGDGHHGARKIIWEAMVSSHWAKARTIGYSYPERITRLGGSCLVGVQYVSPQLWTLHDESHATWRGANCKETIPVSTLTTQSLAVQNWCDSTTGIGNQRFWNPAKRLEL